MIELRDNNSEILNYVNSKSGSNILDCYQCGKCVATCPVSSHMSISPRRIMNFIKLGKEETLFSADSFWYCLSCMNCSARCPREINIPAVMEALRHKSIDKKLKIVSPEIKNIRRFHKIFLEMIKKYGRLYELRLMAEFNIRSGHFFKDLQLAPAAFYKGKMSVLGPKIKNKRALQTLFRISSELEQEDKK